MSWFLLQEKSQGATKAKPSNELVYVVVGTVNDRSFFLSDEMAAMCAKLPIYHIAEKRLVVDVAKQRKQSCSDRM